MAINVSNPNVVRDREGRTYATLVILWGHSAFPGVSVQGLQPLPQAILNVAGGAQQFGTVRGAVINNRLSHTPVILIAPDTGWECYVPALSTVKTPVVTTSTALYLNAPGGTMLTDATKVTLTDFEIPHSVDQQTDFPQFVLNANIPTWFGLAQAATASFNTNLFTNDGIIDHLDIELSGVVVTVAGSIIINLRAVTGLNTILTIPGIALATGTLQYAKVFQLRAPGRIFCDGGLNLQYIVNSGTITGGNVAVFGDLK